jgi:hypothetical protein
MPFLNPEKRYKIQINELLLNKFNFTFLETRVRTNTVTTRFVFSKRFVSYIYNL